MKSPTSENLSLDMDPKTGYNGHIKSRENHMIQPPENCPSCGSVLEWSNDTLYCRNPECEAKTHKRVEHFAKTMKIKGLGPSTIEKLHLQGIDHLYWLDVYDLLTRLESEKLAVKLFEEIEQSKTSSLNTVLPAFGIPLIGRSATGKLSQVVESIFDIDKDACIKAGLGPKATQNLLEWLENDFERYCDLPFSWEFEKTRVPSNPKEIVCISGKLKSYKTKAEASKELQERGFLVKDSLTSDVTILVNESGRETDKTKKAGTMGIRIVTNLKEMMENLNECS